VDDVGVFRWLFGASDPPDEPYYYYGPDEDAGYPPDDDLDEVDDDLDGVPCSECRGYGNHACRACQGSGDNPNDPYADCPACFGSGQVDCVPCGGQGYE